MANIKATQLAITDSINLFITHWKYGHNYEDSTVLVDPAYNIIGWFDRQTENIDVIVTEIPTPGGFVIDNGKGIILKDKNARIKYDSYDYNICRAKFKIKSNQILKEGGSIDGVWDNMVKGMKKYNREYFTELRKKIYETGINES